MSNDNATKCAEFKAGLKAIQDAYTAKINELRERRKTKTKEFNDAMKQLTIDERAAKDKMKADIKTLSDANTACAARPRRDNRFVGWTAIKKQ